MELETLYVVGGEQRKVIDPKKEWHHYQKALVVRVDVASGKAERVVEYVSPPDVCASDENPAIVFKAGTLEEDRLYLCTQTEALVYRLPGFELSDYLSLPWFNDVHHVRPTKVGNLLVASTGLDLVGEVTLAGEVVRFWDALGRDTPARWSPGIDYRKVLTTKPHQSHPNYVFQLGADVWVTRFEQRDAVCLTAPSGRIEIGIEKPHDGIVHEDRIYFTTIDGHIVIVDADSGRVDRIVDLNAITRETRAALGWCRGLKVIAEDRVIVGFTRLRVTRHQENVRWAKYMTGLTKAPADLPTRIAQYDLKEARLVWALDLEPVGMNALFSIH